MEQHGSGEKQMFWEMSWRSLWDLTEQELMLCWHFLPSILPEPLLFLWPLFYYLVSLRSVWLHSHCNCPSSICGLWLPDPQHPLCLTTQNSSIYLSSGHVSETLDISATLCQTSSLLFFHILLVLGGGRGLEGWTNTEYSRGNNRSAE